jgi:hypothetical protein
MALAVPESKVVYTGDGSTDAFPIPFPVDDDELVVLRRLPTAEAGTDDEELSRGVDFDVEDDAETETRSVTFDTAPAVGVSIAILRRLPLVQEVEFEADGDGLIPVAQVQETFDRLTRQLQAVRDDVDRAYKVPHTTATVPAPEKPIANAVLAIDESGERMTFVPVSDLGGDPAPSDFAQAYDFHAYFGTVPPEGEGLSFVLSRAVQLPAGLTGSRATCETAPIVEQVFNIIDTGATVGTITFAAEATAGVITGPVSDLLMTAGDRLSVVLDSDADLTMSGVSISILARTPAG